MLPTIAEFVVPAPPLVENLISFPIELWLILFTYISMRDLKALRQTCKHLAGVMAPFMFSSVRYGNTKQPLPPHLLGFIQHVLCKCIRMGPLSEVENFVLFLQSVGPQLHSLSLHPIPIRLARDGPLWEALIATTALKKLSISTVHNKPYSLGDLFLAFAKKWADLKNNYEPAFTCPYIWSSLHTIEVTIVHSVNEFLPAFDIIKENCINVEVFILNYDLMKQYVGRTLFPLSLIPSSVSRIRFLQISLTQLFDVLRHHLPNLKIIEEFILFDDGTDDLLSNEFAHITEIVIKTRLESRQHLLDKNTWQAVFPNATITVSVLEEHLDTATINHRKFQKILNYHYYGRGSNPLLG